MSAPLAPNTKVGGKYRLQRILGRGGMGEVWLARNESTGAQAALKTLSTEAREEDGDGRFRREARLGGLLSHRHIVQVFDLLEEPGGQLLLVMEFLRGESLGAYLSRVGPLSTRAAVSLVLPALSALEHAHEAGVIHRDVTPANIFLAVDPDGHVTPKLVDFGIAASSSTASASASGAFRTGDGEVLGTPAYMAPEQIRGSRELEPRSDLFSVAVVLVEAITGDSPFAASSPQATLAAVLEREVAPDPRIEARVAAVVQRALAKDPKERFGSARELALALARAVDAAAPADVRIELVIPPRVAPYDTMSPRAQQQVTAAAITRTHAVTRDVRARRSALAWLAVVAVMGFGAGSAVLSRGGPRTAPAAASPVSPPHAAETARLEARVLGPATVVPPRPASAELSRPEAPSSVTRDPTRPASRAEPTRKHTRPAPPVRVARDPGF